VRTELWVRKHCFDGEHDNEHKQSVTRDLVACARTVQEHRDELDLKDVHTRMVSEEIASDPVSTRTRDRRRSQVRPVRPRVSDDGQ
jgi:hypothetical protein